MSLDKAIEHGKEHRKPYGRENGSCAKEVSKACRNHGGCDWCLDDRMHSRNIEGCCRTEISGILQTWR